MATKKNKKEIVVNKTLEKTIGKDNSSNENFVDINIVEIDEETGVDVYDEADLAFAAETRFLSQALEAQKVKMQPQTHPDFDGVHCIDCEDDIPEARLKMKKIRCVHCQELLDKKESRKY